MWSSFHTDRWVMSMENTPDQRTAQQVDAIRRLVASHKADGQSHDQAVATARELFIGPEWDVPFDRFEAERRERVNRPSDFRDITMSAKEDLKEAGWYEGPSSTPGLWSELRDRMQDSSLRDGVEGIDASSTEVVRRLAEPRVVGDRRVGVVVGNVQSGKTANYAAVIAKALDAGYKLVIVLSGIHNNLRSQTQTRLDRDLGVEVGGRWHRLTDANADFGSVEKKNATATLSNVPNVLAVVKKNSRRLSNLLDYLREVDPKTMERVPVLIIDDESDQATPDSSGKDADSPTAINRLLREIWSCVSNGTYVGYTATPFANFFMDPDNDRDVNLPGLYPEDFVHVMPTPDAYFGAERIFGISAEDPESPALTQGLDVIRTIDDAELPSLRPGKRAEVEGFPSAVTDSLGKAIRWFIVAAAIRRVRGQGDKHSTMLVHTTHYTNPHFTMRDAISEFVEKLLTRSREDGDVSAFHEVFHSERDRAAHLHRGPRGAVTWQQVAREIPDVLRQLKVVVDNGREETADRLDYSTGPQTVIVIGGGTLSRGLTLEGLFVSFFTRTSSAYDTLLQMGRWFGYRPGYEDLQRIWVSQGLDEDYRFLARVELEMREEIQRMAATGEKPRTIGVRIRQHPGRLQITSGNKMRHADVVEADYEGYRLQTYIFDAADDEAMDGNLKVTEELLRRLESHLTAEGSAPVYRDVPFGEVDTFLSEFQVHPHFGPVHKAAADWTREKLPEVPWNVVVASGSIRDVQTLRGTPTPVHPVSRSPFSSGSAIGGPGSLNTRVLMTGEDMVLDLRRLGTFKGAVSAEGTKLSTMRAARQNPAQGAGRGLLVLYPISRNSPAPTGAGEKGACTSMREALTALGADPSAAADESRPIIGYGMVLPYDLNGVLERRGQFIAVTPDPVLSSESQEVDAAPAVAEDTEGDYRG